MSAQKFLVLFALGAAWGLFCAILIPSWWCLLPAVVGGLLIGVAIGHFFPSEQSY